MTRNLVRGSCAVGIGVMLLVGVVRTQNRAEEREAAVRKLCDAESGSGGGAAAPATGGLAGRFGVRRPTVPVVIGQGGGGGDKASGTPEIAFESESMATATAGNVVNLTIKGKFEPGSHFVFESDSVQVVRERVTANSYEVSVRMLPTAGPGVVELQAFLPRTCGASRVVPVLVIGGKYAWDLAGGGWKLQLRSAGTGLARTADGKFQETYDAEFFRNTETTPFAVRKAILEPAGEGLYTLAIGGASMEGSGIEEFAKLQDRIMKQIFDPATSDAEKERLSKEFGDATEKFAKQSDATEKRTNIGFVCQAGSLKWDQKAAQAKLECSVDGGPYNTLNLTGTMRTVR